MFQSPRKLSIKSATLKKLEHKKTHSAIAKAGVLIFYPSLAGFI